MPADREFSFDNRRKSVDVGGLALALGAVSLGDEGMEMGKGWGGWEESELSGALYAELLSDMYTQTQSTVNQPVLPSLPTISATTRHRLIDALDSWHFEPHKLPDEEVLACTLLLFEALFRVEGMQETVGVSIAQLSSFLLHLRHAYRATNSYHNFQHALDVFQATHIYLRSAGVVPPVAILHLSDLDPRGHWRAHDEIRASWVGILRKEDLFALYIAAVGHDVGHPGFNNMFMKNAQAPLSQVYDHKSALEQMHCAFLLPIMKRHGLAHLLGLTPAGMQFRRLLLDTVLATDMGVHTQFMKRFTRFMENPLEFDITQARTLLCQALIKCADISNPVGFMCLPIQMKGFAEQCATNCRLWRARLADLKEHTERLQPNYPPVPYRVVSPPETQDYLTVFPLSLPTHLFHPLSRSPSMMDSDSIVGSESGNEVGHERERRAHSVSDSADAMRLSSTAVPNGNGREKTNGHSVGAVAYADSISSSSRSASPTSLTSSSAPILSLPSLQSQQTLPAIGIPAFSLPSEFSPATETSESMSPRSEYAPRTPGSYAGGVVRPVASNGSLNGSASGTSYAQASEPISSIRAAYRLSVRKKKSFHRNSWTSSPSQHTLQAAVPPIPSPLSSSGSRAPFAVPASGLGSTPTQGAASTSIIAPRAKRADSSMSDS
ncbi:hypothetical protein EW145_g7374 [Phellinidium pouzarii]|uniref:Phosphodiesterase n=1 Tax=Phellinidium pouzarii TaxID=167371 RepID=A0A4S4KJY5_9AGAM|nr:hypothetical protein EW145_g7374 [Phellinidium pouzarii]